MDQEPGKVTADSASPEQAIDAAVPSAQTSSDELRSQIEQTRAEMSQTIDAIQTRLSPSAHPVELVLLGAAAAAFVFAISARPRTRTGRNRRTVLLGACTTLAGWAVWRVRRP